MLASHPWGSIRLSHFEFVTVFISIVVAIGVAELLAGLGRLIRDRDRVKVYWVHVGWMILGILAQSSSWWEVWNVRAREIDNYYAFMGLVLPNLLFVLIAFLLSPSIEAGRSFDLRAYYYRQVRWIAPLFAVQLSVLGLSRIMLGIQEPVSINVIRALVVGVFILLGVSSNEKLHRGAVFLVSAMFVLSVVVVALQAGGVGSAQPA